MSKDQVV